MKLSLKQKAALLRMKRSFFWAYPKGDGRVHHGFDRTLWSLQDKGLVRYVRAGEILEDGEFAGEEVVTGGWVLTKLGEGHASIVEHEALQPTKDATELQRLAAK